MKKILMSLIVGFILLVGCSTSPVNEVIDKFENEESFVFVLGSSTCIACTTYKPILEEFIDQKDAEVLYVEVDTTDKTALETIVNDYIDGNLEYTPTTYVIEEGEVAEVVVGSISYSDLITLFEKHGMLED